MKGQYQVQAEVLQPQDASFRVCLCTLLVLLAMFGITAFCLWPKNLNMRTGYHLIESQDNRNADPLYRDQEFTKAKTTFATSPVPDTTLKHTSEVFFFTFFGKIVPDGLSSESTTQQNDVLGSTRFKYSKEVQSSSNLPTTEVSVTKYMNKDYESEYTEYKTFPEQTTSTTDSITVSEKASTETSHHHPTTNNSGSDSLLVLLNVNTTTTPIATTTPTATTTPSIGSEISIESKTTVQKLNIISDNESRSTEHQNIPEQTTSNTGSTTLIKEAPMETSPQNPAESNSESSLLLAFSKIHSLTTPLPTLTTPSGTDSTELSVKSSSLSLKADDVSELQTTKLENLIEQTTDSTGSMAISEKPLIETSSKHAIESSSELSILPISSNDDHSPTQMSTTPIQVVTETTTESNKLLEKVDNIGKDYESETTKQENLSEHTTVSTESTTVSEKSLIETFSQRSIKSFPWSNLLAAPSNVNDSIGPVCTTTKPAPAEDVCTTSQCYATASRLLSLLDPTVDPCEDFYSYSCGGLLHNPLLLEEDPALDIWNRIEKAVKNVSNLSPTSYQKLRNYYEGCVNYDQLVSKEERKRQGREILKSVGQFVKALETPDEDIPYLIVKLFQLGSAPLFDIRLDVDSTNATKFQAVFTLPRWESSHFVSPEENKRCSVKAGDEISEDLSKAYEDYKNCIGDFAHFIATTKEALEFFEIFDSHDNATQFIEDIMKSLQSTVLDILHVNISKLDLSKKKIQSKSHQLLSLAHLNTLLPMMDWSSLLTGLLKVDVDGNTVVQVYFLEYFLTFFGEFGKKGERDQYNSLLAMFAHNLYTDIVRLHRPCSREHYCLRVAASLMPLITSNMFLATFPPHTRTELQRQVTVVNHQLVSVMEEKLAAAVMLEDQSAGWMDDKTSKEISNKLKTLSVRLPVLVDGSDLDASLGDCALNTQQYINDTVCLLRQFQVQLYSRYTLDPNSSYPMWPHFLTAFSAEASFVYGLNSLMIPLGAVGPVYDQRMPRHVVLGQLGNVVARAIGHTFDTTGVKFSAAGKMGKILSEESDPSYQDNLNFIVSLFAYTNSLEMDGRIYNFKTDSVLSQDQRLSDITAANISLGVVADLEDTKLPWIPFSNQQVYFLSLAQTFCSKKKIQEIYVSLFEETILPSVYRVSNIAKQSEQFALAFDCPVGSKMNPNMKFRPFPVFEYIPPSFPDIA